MILLLSNYITIHDLKDPFVISFKPDEHLTKVRSDFRKYSPRIALVIDDSNKLIGVIYRATLIALTSTKSNLTVRDLVERPKITASPDAKIDVLLSNMVEKDEWSVPLLEGSTITGTISLESFLLSIYKKNILKEKLSATYIQDIMSTDVRYVTSDETVAGTVRKLIKEKFAGLPVVDNKMRCIGIITHYDLLSKGYTRISLDSESGPSREPKVKDVMTSPATTITPDETIWKAIELMGKRGYGRLPVVDDKRKLIGIIDRSDVANLILKVTK